MDVGIHEARRHGAAGEVDAAGLGARERLDLGGRTDRHDPLSADGHGFGDAALRVERDYAAVHQDQVGGVGRR